MLYTISTDLYYKCAYTLSLHNSKFYIKVLAILHHTIVLYYINMLCYNTSISYRYTTSQYNMLHYAMLYYYLI